MDNNKFIQEIYRKYEREKKGTKDSFYSSGVYRSNQKMILKTVAMFVLAFVIIGCVFYAGVAATKYFEKLSMKPSFTSGLGESDMNDVWIGTFQLIWNDAMDKIAHGPIEFEDGESELADELNKRSFTEDMLSEDSYYKIFGLATSELKGKIEKELQEKFQENSRILDRFSWERKWLYFI